MSQSSDKRSIGSGLVDPAYLPAGADEDYLRDQPNRPQKPYVQLTQKEIAILERNGNVAECWNEVLVGRSFDPSLVHNCTFAGLVRLGGCAGGYVESGGIRYRTGLFNSTIVASDIGENCAVSDVSYLCRYSIGDGVVIARVGSLSVGSAPKFGTGVKKLGETESNRTRIAVANENGGRSILPFQGMTSGDAWLWAAFRADEELLSRFTNMVDDAGDVRHGQFGVVGSASVIIDCGSVKDTFVGDGAVIEGARSIHDASIMSSQAFPSKVGRGVEIESSIIGNGCRVDTSALLTRVITGSNVRVRAGARVFDSYVGDNATVSCGEVVSSLMFPFYEQHHTNSFLCAALLGGQANIAAGATIGSNHNTRSADGEIVAGRGFWPALSVSLKHDSVFPAFTLIAKGSYQYCLHIPFPFSLVSDNQHENVLSIMPAYWLIYNQYALVRNEQKFAARDGRPDRIHDLELSYLAPDTVDEMKRGMEILEILCGSFVLREAADLTRDADPHRRLGASGREVLRSGSLPESIDIDVTGIESSRRPVRLLRPARAYGAYHDAIVLFCIKALCEYAAPNPDVLADVIESMSTPVRTSWLNVGGQLMPEHETASLTDDVKSGLLATWDAVHLRYREIAERMPLMRARYGLATLLDMHNRSAEGVSKGELRQWAESAVAIQRRIAETVKSNREKDYQNHFRSITYRTSEERDAVLGTINDDEVVSAAHKDAEAFAAAVQSVFG